MNVMSNNIFTRDRTRRVVVGDVAIGGGAAISVQSMAKVPTTDVSAVLKQCEDVLRAGGDLFRISVPDESSAAALKEIVKNSPRPIIADIHFDYRLALLSLDAGVHKLRINPGNIGSPERVKIVAKEAAARSVPIRIGVNSGSLPEDIAEDENLSEVDAMVKAAEREISILEDAGFFDIVVSLKSSSPAVTIEANRKFAQKYNYPLHIGITESGFGEQGIVASAVGLTLILNEGIGDTVRVSLSEPPENEIRVAREILRFLKLRKYGARLISCPTCARSEGDIQQIAPKIFERIKNIAEPITVAVMGCVVNGPGEAKSADIGVACGKNQALIFKNGKPLRKIAIDDIVDELLCEIDDLITNR